MTNVRIWLLVLLVLASCGSQTTGQSGDELDVVFTPPWDTAGLDLTILPDGAVLLPDGAVFDPDAFSATDVPDTDSQEIASLPDGQVILPDDFEIDIVSPTEGGVVSGSVVVRVEPVGYEELVLDSVTVYINETYAWTDVKLPTEFTVDTTKFPGDQPFVISATAKQDYKTGSDTRTVTLDNPGFGFAQVSTDESVVRNGDTVHIRIDAGVPGLTVSGDFSALDSAFQPGAESVVEEAAGQYLVSYQISTPNNRSDGSYVVPLKLSDGPRSLDYPHLTLDLQNKPLIPIRLKGGIFVPGAVPAASAGWVQPISLVYGNEFIITGGSAKVNLDFSGYAFLSEIVGVLIGVDGFYGYYQMPLEGSPGEEELLLLMRVYASNETAPAQIPVKIALQDARGRISPVKIHNLAVESVGSGDVQVSISWDSPTDVDLHVIEPGGCELYYGHKTCSSGGWLDLDSNPACAIDGINNENAFWPAGSAPLGTYTVRVDYYDDCGGLFGGGGHEANYTVTMNYCGLVDTVDGHFNAGSDDGGGAGDGVTVATFNNESCGRIMSGRVRYQDKPFDRNGFSGQRWSPVRFAKVQVIRRSDDAVLGTAYTNRFGDYEIQFNNHSTPGIFLRVQPQTDLDEALRQVVVMNHPKFKAVYKVDSDPIEEGPAENPVLDLDITEEDSAGAFNIFDSVVEGYDSIRLMTGRNLGLLNVYWATGADTTDTLYCSQFFYDTGVCSEMGALSVQGKDTDRDEYDDQVILKEFFKFALEKVSRDDNPGGEHTGTRDNPNRSWSEGLTTYFAADLQGTAWFVNSRPNGVYEVFQLDQWNSPFAYGTSTNAMDSNVSEYLVASVLWDLADDNTIPEAFDLVVSQRRAIFDSVFSYFRHSLFADRGVPGVDLVDFLDGWFCRDWENSSGLGALLNEMKFPYDFHGPVGCATP